MAAQNSISDPERRTVSMAQATALIIDDSTELRSLLESILPYSGYRTISASTGEEGLNLALKLKPDVILVDLELPDTTGLQVLAELKQHQLAIPTIMITGYGSEGVAARALQLGALGYLIKPFTTEEVLSSLERALTVKRLRREKEQLANLLDTYARHFQTLAALGRAMIDGLDPDQFYQRVVEAGLYVTRAERCLLALSDQARKQLHVVAAHGRPYHTRHPLPLSAGDTRLQTILEQGISVRLHASPGSTITSQTGDAVRAVLQVPLKIHDRVFGLLSVDREDRDIPFGRHDEQMMAILADYVVIALEKHHQFDQVLAAHQSQDISSPS
jgi:two-component system NtrC family sensor kinase